MQVMGAARFRLYRERYRHVSEYTRHVHSYERRLHPTWRCMFYRSSMSGFKRQGSSFARAKAD